MRKRFSDINPQEALQLAEKRLEELPSNYGQDMTKRELEFAIIADRRAVCRATSCTI